MHQADCMAARIEYEAWVNQSPTATKIKKKNNKLSDSVSKQDASKLFGELFGS